MAEVWTFKNEPYVGEYTRETVTHRVTRRYVVTGLVSGAPVEEILRTDPHPTTYPEWIAFTRHVSELFTGDFVENRLIYCYPCTLRVANMPSATCLEVDVTYIGRTIGTISLAQRTQMFSQVRYESLAPSPNGTFKGIGVEFEGTPVDVPMVVYNVEAVIDGSQFKTMSNLEDLISGSVNEDGWLAPWDHVYPEGSVIYLGPQQAVVDRCSNTVSLLHVFARLQNRRHQHIFRWREYSQTLSDEGLKMREYKSGAEEEGKILKIAGTDDWWDDATAIPPFSSLGLEFPIQ